MPDTDTKTKDLDATGHKLNNVNTGSNSSAPRPTRGLEARIDQYDNPTEARTIAGSGHQGYGRAGYGPDVSTGISRGQFASRTKLTSKP